MTSGLDFRLQASDFRLQTYDIEGCTPTREETDVGNFIGSRSCRCNGRREKAPGERTEGMGPGFPSSAPQMTKRLHRPSVSAGCRRKQTGHAIPPRRRLAQRQFAQQPDAERQLLVVVGQPVELEQRAQPQLQQWECEHEQQQPQQRVYGPPCPQHLPLTHTLEWRCILFSLSTTNKDDFHGFFFSTLPPHLLTSSTPLTNGLPPDTRATAGRPAPGLL